MAPKPQLKKPVLKNIERRKSALSLKSVHLKKDTSKKTAVEENYDNHPRTTFSEKDLLNSWNIYQQKLVKLGQKNMAYCMSSDTPKLLENYVISFALPSNLMETQLQTGKPDLVRFLRENLNNYGIVLDLQVNETIEKKFAYTPQEKFNKLKEKNPLLEELKNKFQLDL